MKEVVVIGAGLAGLYAAYTASMHGANVKVYEKRDGIGVLEELLTLVAAALVVGYKTRNIIHHLLFNTAFLHYL